MSAATRFGSVMYQINNNMAYSDEESTEPVIQHKAIVRSKTASMEDNVWWQINSDFALDSDDDYNYSPAAVKASKPVVQKSSSITPPMAEDDWMALNNDFARDCHSEDEMEVDEQPKLATRKAAPALQEYGDYGVWWE